ncbi:hypothetical protein VIGAN_03206000 [Vigna angularis var. angularis]|uniref:Uncharacterized protein n=1 Tax=Vigna angularis var. angularis TaxID=157739 RepID=A0A0S3RNB6_PHAAN|nr:hypothetical protein VIGAN_03206000 [Vigna angularis var. angularis]
MFFHYTVLSLQLITKAHVHSFQQSHHIEGKKQHTHEKLGSCKVKRDTAMPAAHAALEEEDAQHKALEEGKPSSRRCPAWSSHHLWKVTVCLERLGSRLRKGKMEKEAFILERHTRRSITIQHVEEGVSA